MSFDGRLLGGVGVMAAVVETGNFARAGDALGLTQSGVSRAIARLEMRIGVRLFDRTPRAVTLTDEGRRFHQSVVPLLTGLEDAATEAAGTAAVGMHARAPSAALGSGMRPATTSEPSKISGHARIAAR